MEKDERADGDTGRLHAGDAAHVRFTAASFVRPKSFGSKVTQHGQGSKSRYVATVSFDTSNTLGDRGVHPAAESDSQGRRQLDRRCAAVNAVAAIGLRPTKQRAIVHNQHTSKITKLVLAMHANNFLLFVQGAGDSGSASTQRFLVLVQLVAPTAAAVTACWPAGP